MLLDQTRRLAVPVVAALFCVASCQSPEPVTPEQTSAATMVDASTGTATPAAGAQDPQDPIEVQRRRFLVQKYLEDAQKLRADGKLEEAKLMLLKAKETAPGDQRVGDALASLQAEMGVTAGTAQDFGEQMERLVRIREQRATADVQSRLESARRALGEGNHQNAIHELRNAILVMEVGRDIEWGGLEDQARRMLADAERARDERTRALEEHEQRETLARLRAAEEADLARRRTQVEGYMATAIRAFSDRKFKLAQELSFKAMQLEPTNLEARNLHNASTKAMRESRMDEYFAQKRREFMGFLEATEDLRTPQTDILRTDPTTWERAKRRSAAKAPDIVESPDDAAVRQEVRTRKVPPRKFTAETGSYDEVKNLLQTLTNIPIIITPEAREVITSESLTLEMELIADLSVENFLNQMVGKSANLAWIIKNAVVQITSKAKAGGDKILVTHDVRDLVFQRTDFLPPTIRDLPSGDTSTGPRTGGEADEKVAFIEPDQIQLAIREATGTANWEGDGAASMEFAEGGYLIVTANPTLQQAVQQFLDDQRRFATAVVTIDSKFLTVSQNFLQQIGVDWRGLGGSGQKGSVATLDDVTNRLDDNSSRGLDNGGTGDPAGHPLSGLFFNDGGDGDVRARTENYFQSSLGRVLSPLGGATIGFTLLDDTELAGLLRAVEKRDNVQVVNSQLLTVMNTERANVAVINQTSFVRDFDVEVAQASFIADPKVDVIQDGIVLDVRPVIRWDRKHIHLQLSPTVAELQRPIPTFTTSLAGSTLPVTLQLPVLTVRSFATTVDVPDGGSVLIGGLRELLQKERRAEIPLLGGIPLIGFFFKEEGVVDENNSLMVLVTARITDIKDVVEGR